MEIKEAILSWIINLNKDYNYINKRFQDTVMNYFLEDYIAPLLMQDYNLQVYREIHVILKNKLKLDKDRVLPKYMGILNIYTNELKEKNRYSEYKRKLCQIIQEETAHSSSNFNSQMWKKLVAFLLLEHSVNNNIKNFNGMWQSAFPDRPLKKVKLPKYSKNNTSYYKKRMLILKQKELEFDYQQNLKNNQVILNMLIGSNSNSTQESSLNQTIVCEVSNKPQFYSQPQIQIHQYAVSQSNSQSTFASSSISCPILSHSSQSGYSNSSCSNTSNYMNDRRIQPSSIIINEKVEIKEEDIQDNLHHRRFSESEINQDDNNDEDVVDDINDEDDEEYPEGSLPSSGLAKIEDNNCENEYPSSQQQLYQSYASSSQQTVQHYGKQQKLPNQQHQQQKYESLQNQQQQQQNQYYLFVNNNSVNNNTYNNYQNLINPVGSYNNITNNNLNNNNNYYNFSDKFSQQYPQYSDEEFNDDYMQEAPVMINSEFNESQEQRQGEEPFYYDEECSKQYQPPMMSFYNNFPSNHLFCNSDCN